MAALEELQHEFRVYQPFKDCDCICKNYIQFFHASVNNTTAYTYTSIIIKICSDILKKMLSCSELICDNNPINPYRLLLVPKKVFPFSFSFLIFDNSYLQLTGNLPKYEVV